MPTLSIKNVPESLLGKLRERAAQHHRSMQGELMALLTAAVQAEAIEGRSPERTSHSPPAERPLGRRTGTRRIEDIAAEHLERRKQPAKKGPLAVDLIRADRDAR